MPRSPSSLELLLHSSRAAAIFSDEQTLRSMLAFEAALARAEARIGIIPDSAAEAIGSCCHVSRFDFASIAQDAARDGNIAISMVRQLTMLVRHESQESAGFVHWGATSQDAIDTGLVLQLRQQFDLLRDTLWLVAEELAQQTERDANTVIAGRTWLQHAVPTTFGLKAAGFLDAVLRHLERLSEVRTRTLVLQFGGAAGTLASLQDKGPAVAAALAQELGLAAAATPWHAYRDSFAETACLHGLIAGTCGKFARDIALLGQSEVAEAAGAGGGSSTMPHKRNPVAASAIVSAATRVPGLVSTMLSAMLQEHERGLGNWQAEWETLPQICTLTLGAVEKMATLLQTLELDTEAMRANLSATHGLLMAESVSMALAAHIGRDRAHARIEAASRAAIAQSMDLSETLALDPQITQHLSPASLDRLLQPANYLGAAGTFCAQVLQRFHAASKARSADHA